MLKYLVSGSIRDGEAEYPFHFLAQTSDMKELDKIAQDKFNFGNFRTVEVDFVDELNMEKTNDIDRLLYLLGVNEY